jgi:hypothetical protein
MCLFGQLSGTSAHDLSAKKNIYDALYKKYKIEHIQKQLKIN